MTTAARHPLSWPHGWKRTVGYARRQAKFGKRVQAIGSTYSRLTDLTVADGIRRLLAELAALGARDVIISTNIPTRLDGLPYSQAREPEDPGVAVYFKLAKAERVLACDRYTKVAGNLAAIAAHVEALRAIERYGVGTLDQAFAGYQALPPEPSSDWHLVLGVDPGASLDDIESAYRLAAFQAHPDRGGTHEAMTRLNAARDAAVRARRAS